MHWIIDIPTENLQDFDDIALFFGLGKVKDVSGISTWYSNKNFLVRTNIGAYVFRFIKKYNTRIIENEIAINTQLKWNGRINTNYLLSNNTWEFVYQRNWIVVVVSEKIEWAHPIKITDEMSFAIGKTLWEFHKCVTYIPYPWWHWLLSFQSTQDQANKLPHSLYKEKIQELLNRAKSIQIGIDLPEGIIHGDLHRENLLISGEHPETIVSILDMEHANSGILVLDIARSIIDICRDAVSYTHLDVYKRQVIAWYSNKGCKSIFKNPWMI